VRLAYKELADEELRQRDPSKWRDTELFEINQLFNRCGSRSRTYTHAHATARATWWC
jgi:hypothetical protein